MNFYISDTHFGHENVLAFDGRPFSSVEEMESELIRRWNSVVGKGDIVYILGDFCWGKESEWIRILRRLNGNKVLIRGNHDIKGSEALRKMFSDVKDYKEIKDNGRKVILSHYPIPLYHSAYDPNCYMLCGHVHDTKENGFLTMWKHHLRYSRRSENDNHGQIYNVGCMLPYMDYTPRTLDEIVRAVEDD